MIHVRQARLQDVHAIREIFLASYGMDYSPRFYDESYDRWEDVWRSLVQLVLGTYMVCDARRLRLCERYFETHAADLETAKADSASAVCPISHR